MAANYYQKFTTSEIAEAYTTTIANYGKIEGELLEEINRRGGEALLQEEIAKEKTHRAERARIYAEVYKLTGAETDAALLNKLITSDIFDSETLNSLVEQYHAQHQKAAHNSKTDIKTITGCAVGALAGIACGQVLLFVQATCLGAVFYVSLVIVWFIAYFFIRLITKKVPPILQYCFLHLLPPL